MAKTVGDILVERRDAILSAFAYARFPLIQVQVEGTEALKRLAYVQDSGFVEAQPQQLGGRNPERVTYIQSKVDPNLNSSVWVASNYSGYAGAYVAFLNKTYGVEATAADLAGYNVDHLLNRARSPQNSTLIRLEATPADANQAWGRLFEKAASDPSFYANKYRERRTMDFMICAKLGGQMPPLGPRDNAAVNNLSNFFTTVGIPRREAQDGLESILKFAYKLR